MIPLFIYGSLPTSVFMLHLRLFSIVLIVLMEFPRVLAKPVPVQMGEELWMSSRIKFRS